MKKESVFNERHRGEAPIRLPSLALRLFFVIGTALFARSFYWVIGDNEAGGGVVGTQLVYQGLSLLFYAGGAYFFGSRLRFTPNTALLFFLLALVTVSSAWSVDPGGTLLRSLSLWGTALFYLAYLKKVPIAIIVEDTSKWIALAAALSIVFAVAVPSIGIENTGDNVGNWRGIFEHKNQTAYVLLLGLILQVAWVARTRSRLSILCLLITAAMLWQTASRGAILIVLAAGALTFLVSLLKRRKHVSFAIFFFAASVGLPLTYTLWAEQAAVLEAMGRDTTLTGRTDIWAAAITYITNSPWLGYGYQAVWQSNSGIAALLTIQSGWGWIPGHAHNGYLDLLLSIGAVGAVVYGLFFVRLLARALYYAGNGQYAWAILETFVACAILGLTGRSVLQPNTFYLLFLLIPLGRFAPVGFKFRRKGRLNAKLRAADRGADLVHHHRRPTAQTVVAAP